MILGREMNDRSKITIQVQVIGVYKYKKNVTKLNNVVTKEMDSINIRKI